MSNNNTPEPSPVRGRVGWGRSGCASRPHRLTCVRHLPLTGEEKYARHPNWESRLDTLIRQWQSRPFVWGQTDCAQFALAVLKAISVRDWAQISVQPYKTARAAHALLQRLGAEDMPALADKMLGPRVPVSYAQRGDIVSAVCRFGPALGVCLGAHIALPGEDGLVYRPLSSAFAAWRI